MSTLAVPLVHMDFNMRKDYIATVLCINKDTPVLKCNGKCYLAKKLKAAKERQEKGKEVSFKSGFYFFAYQKSNKDQILPYRLLEKLYTRTSQGQIDKGLIWSIDRPPRV